LIAPFYSLGIFLLELGIYLKSLYDPGVKRWRSERQLRKTLNGIPDIVKNEHNRLWVHCASLGEYYMIRPVLIKLKERSLDIQICLSFFSPSGYHHVSDTSIVDYKFYLPSDTNSNAIALIQKIQPDLFIGVKYEFWWKLLYQLQRHDVPIFYTNINFTKSPGFFNFIFRRYKKFFLKFQQIFVQYPVSKKVLSQS
jgi:3-deoxy-D-manno-octulosonic-acid transferase